MINFGLHHIIENVQAFKTHADTNNVPEEYNSIAEVQPFT